VSSRLFGIVGGVAYLPVDEAHGDEECAYPRQSFVPFVWVGLFDIFRCWFVFASIIQDRCLVLLANSSFGCFDQPPKIAAWIIKQQ
jgi:hypothetical protein